MDTQPNLPPAQPIKRWGARSGKQWTGPTWSRFRLLVQYYNGNAKYHSYDYTFKHEHGFKKKIKSERIGLTKLMEMMHKKTKGKVYRYANIFVNIGSDLSTTTGNFDYLVCTIVNGTIKWKDPLYWKREPEECMLDISKMRAWRKENDNKIEAEAARLEVQKALEQTMLNI